MLKRYLTLPMQRKKIIAANYLSAHCAASVVIWPFVLIDD
jgi:hypothetical protein